MKFQTVRAANQHIETLERENAELLNRLSEANQRAERAERIADMAAIELIRSCTVLAVDGDDWRDSADEDLEPELTYALARGLVERKPNDTLLRFTEFARERGNYDQTEPLEAK